MSALNDEGGLAWHNDQLPMMRGSWSANKMDTVITVNIPDEGIKNENVDRIVAELELSIEGNWPPSFIWHANWDIKVYSMRKHRGG